MGLGWKYVGAAGGICLEMCGGKQVGSVEYVWGTAGGNLSEMCWAQVWTGLEMCGREHMGLILGCVGGQLLGLGFRCVGGTGVSGLEKRGLQIVGVGWDVWGTAFGTGLLMGC